MGTGPDEAKRGVLEEAKGMAKELGGEVTGNERMRQEGEAQQEKADAHRDAARAEARAEKERAQAQRHEAEQRANQQ
ncbi:MAG TPA: hypothetical protein VNU01_03315 [Egibacteraceae bacterium]|nr:hypothetical protein [Egibacteraceae bacterium]